MQLFLTLLLLSNCCLEDTELVESSLCNAWSAVHCSLLSDLFGARNAKGPFVLSQLKKVHIWQCIKLLPLIAVDFSCSTGMHVVLFTHCSLYFHYSVAEGWALHCARVDFVTRQLAPIGYRRQMAAVPVFVVPGLLGHRMQTWNFDRCRMDCIVSLLEFMASSEVAGNYLGCDRPFYTVLGTAAFSRTKLTACQHVRLQAAVRFLLLFCATYILVQPPLCPAAVMLPTKRPYLSIVSALILCSPGLVVLILLVHFGRDDHRKGVSDRGGAWCLKYVSSTVVQDSAIVRCQAESPSFIFLLVSRTLLFQRCFLFFHLYLPPPFLFCSVWGKSGCYVMWTRRSNQAYAACVWQPVMHIILSQTNHERAVSLEEWLELGALRRLQ